MLVLNSIGQSINSFCALPDITKIAIIMGFFVVSFCIAFISFVKIVSGKFTRIDREEEIYRAMRGDE